MPRRKRSAPKARKQPRRPEVFVVQRGADMNCDWTAFVTPPEQGRFPKYVHVMGGHYDPERKTFPGPDSIRVGITEGDPEGVSVHFTIYCVEATDRPDDLGFMESFIYAEDVREIHAALTAAIEQAEQLGIIPPAKPIKPELRVGPFEYTGERGAGGRWTGKKVPPRENRVC